MECSRKFLRFFSCEPGKTMTASGYSFFAATMDERESKVGIDMRRYHLLVRVSFNFLPLFSILV